MDTPTVKSPTISNRCLRALFGSIPGIGLGVFCFAVLGYGTVPSVIVGSVGAFIGAALAQPDVSKSNVFKGAAGAIIANNVPIFMSRDEPVEDAPRPPKSPTDTSHIAAQEKERGSV